MATCTEADYGQISLAVLQKSSEKLDESAGGPLSGMRQMGDSRVIGKQEQA